MSALQAKQIEISIQDQKLYLTDSGKLIKEYDISSSKYGEGSESGSFKTPLGKHAVKKMIGGGQPHGAAHLLSSCLLYTSPSPRDS